MWLSFFRSLLYRGMWRLLFGGGGGSSALKMDSAHSYQTARHHNQEEVITARTSHRSLFFLICKIASYGMIKTNFLTFRTAKCSFRYEASK
jgi:hypothetical protein